MIKDYLIQRKNLYLCYLLIDGSIPIQKIDQEIMQLLHSNQIPFISCLQKQIKSQKEKDQYC